MKRKNTQTKRRKSKEPLRNSELHLSEAMDLANIVYWESDPIDGMFIFNDPFYLFYGTTAGQEGGYRMSREEYAKRFIHPDDQESFYQFVQRDISKLGAQFVADMEHRIIRRDGEVRHILARTRILKDESGRIIKRYGANQDITDLKNAEEEKHHLELQLLQAQKMEAIGALAGGIAHDFNNILEGIIGFSEMIKGDMSADNAQYRRIDLVLKGALRGRDLVKQILAFCRQSKQEQKAVGLKEIVEEGLKLIRPILPSTIDITFTCLTEDDTVYADSVQMHQVLMNLCTNASHAMREQGGLLTIRISNCAFEEIRHMVSPSIREGRYVVLTLQDNGCGMPPEILDRVFDPFFSTKRPGEGTGLGLSVVHGIISSHSGYVAVRSKPGIGSTFSVFLPAAGKAAHDSGKEIIPPAGGKERILFVDDEEILVNLNEERLNKLGYTVVATTSSREALEIFKKEPYGFDLVISDYTMPSLTGLDLSAEIRRIRPDIPIIISTGYNDSISREMAATAGISELLMKPQSKDELAQAVRRSLSAEPKE